MRKIRTFFTTAAILFFCLHLMSDFDIINLPHNLVTLVLDRNHTFGKKAVPLFAIPVESGVSCVATMKEGAFFGALLVGAPIALVL